MDAPTSLGPPFVLLTRGRRQYSTLQANSVLSPTVLNNFRFAFNRTFATNVENAPDQPSFVPGQPFGAIQTGGLGTSGSMPLTPLSQSTGNGPSLWVFNLFEWGDDFSYVRGKHSLKTGINIQRMQDNTTKTPALCLKPTYAN